MFNCKNKSSIKPESLINLLRLNLCMHHPVDFHPRALSAFRIPTEKNIYSIQQFET